MAKLILKLGSLVLKEINLVTDSITIGRANDNDIVLDNQSASGHHAKIIKVANQYKLEDLNSTNGTFVNNNKVANKILKEGDIIAIGKHELWFVGENSESLENADLEKTVFVRSTATPSSNKTTTPSNPQPLSTPKPNIEKINSLKDNDTNIKIIAIVIVVLVLIVIGYILFK